MADNNMAIMALVAIVAVVGVVSMVVLMNGSVKEVVVSPDYDGASNYVGDAVGSCDNACREYRDSEGHYYDTKELNECFDRCRSPALIKTDGKAGIDTW